MVKTERKMRQKNKKVLGWREKEEVRERKRSKEKAR